MDFNGHAYFQNYKTNNRIYWLCSKNRHLKCNARVITTIESLQVVKTGKHPHNHGHDGTKDES